MLESFFMLGESIISKLGEKLVEFTFNQDDEANLESLQRNIRSLCEKAKDVDEQIKMAELCSRKKRKRVVEDWLEQVQLIETEFHNLETKIQREGFIKRFLGRGRAKKLDSRVHELDEKSNSFGELVIDSYDFKGEKFSTRGLVGEEFQKNLEHIMRLLLEDKVPSIGIHGMGGVGKTTLVQHVNNQLIEQTQEHVNVVWITVSQEFTIAMLQDKIAKVLGLGPLDESDEDRRASKLNQALSQRKNFAMIFDDVWEKIDFRKLGDPHSIDGCRLLITSRSKKLCHQLDCKKLIKVQTLKQNEAWILFTEALAQDNLSPEVEGIAKSLVKLCKGLPLGIITLAGGMKGEYDIHVWRNAFEELRGSMMEFEEQVFNVLKYSFDRLDRIKAGTINCYSKLQQCFLCCSLFPEDHWIRRDDLIELFILEEYLDKRDNRKALFEQGHAIVDHLVNVSLLERVNRDRVKMHDLVRAMALKITEGTTKVMVGNRSLKEIPNDGEWTKELEKMSLMMNDIRTIPDGMCVKCPKLSTLILSENKDLEFIPKSFFLQMCNLSILNLSSTKIKRLPDEVSNMENLKALILGGCHSLVYVPCLGKLEKLRKLDVSRTAIREVPQGTEKLINLQFLALNGISKLQMLPSNFVLNFQYLQCLYLPNQILVEVEELTELKYLEEFGGRVKDWNGFLHLIRSRENLGYNICVQQLDNDSSDPFARYHHDYNGLRLSGCDVKELKDEDVDVLEVGIIRHLLIKKCEGWSSNILVEDIGQLINPTFLEYLGIMDCEGIERIIRKKQCGGATSTSPLIVQFYVFTSLTSLSISGCKNIKSLGISVTQLPNLGWLIIEGCSEMEEIFEVEKGREECGSGHMQTTVSSLSKLHNIYLWNLPKLKSISNATIVCASLDWIQMWECESLKKFPIVFGEPNYDSPPLRLESIQLRRSEMEWWKKMELGHPTHHTLLQPFIHWFSVGSTKL